MYREIEHTADYAIHVSSPDLEGLFLDSARGMYALTGGQVKAVSTTHRIQLEAPDLETLLVGWLEELGFILEVEGEMAAEITFLELQPSTLVAELHTGPAVGVSKLIKAVTFHNLQVRSSVDGYETSIVFDV